MDTIYRAMSEQGKTDFHLAASKDDTMNQEYNEYNKEEREQHDDEKLQKINETSME